MFSEAAQRYEAKYGKKHKKVKELRSTIKKVCYFLITFCVLSYF
jgi:hypothetical protein